jgi:hypothetical protein
MNAMISTNHFTASLNHILEETFETHHGIYLDKGTSLLDTLKGISAQEASIPVGGKCASLAAQVTHIIFYLEVLESYIAHNDSSPTDWGAVWRTVEKVTPEEWEALKIKLETTYHRTSKVLNEIETWTEDMLGGALAEVVHTAYHLGEIRQALCTLRR